MKSTVARVAAIAATSLALAAIALAARADNVPTTDTYPLTGQWWNANESGWGISIAQHGTAIFAAWYTYDASGKPQWIVVPSCPLVGNGCSGDMYTVNGGASISAAWNGGGIVTKVGTSTFTFTDNDNGRVTFTLNGAAGSKTITRQSFGSGAATSSLNYTDLWWNENESGWGAAITQQLDIVFATIYTYDAAGAPIWYVAPRCVLANGRCTSDAFRVQGGSQPTVTWAGANRAVIPVGSVSFAFADRGRGTMSFTLEGARGSKAITRQAFVGEGAVENAYSEVFDGYRAVANGGYRHRGIYATDAAASTSTECGFVTFPTRGEVEDAIRTLGGAVLQSSRTEWCGRAGTETSCIKMFDNAFVLDTRDLGDTAVEIHMGGLFSSRTTVVRYDTLDRATALVAARTRDNSIVEGVSCSNANQGTHPRDAINGNWTGYRFFYNLASKSGSTWLATMSCVNQTCTLLSDMSSTFTLSEPTLWRTPASAPRQVGAALSTDRELASVYVCTSPLDERRAFEVCHFYTFKRMH